MENESQSARPCWSHFFTRKSTTSNTSFGNTHPSLLPITTRKVQAVGTEWPQGWHLVKKEPPCPRKEQCP